MYTCIHIYLFDITCELERVGEEGSEGVGESKGGSEGRSEGGRG